MESLLGAHASVTVYLVDSGVRRSSKIQGAHASHPILLCLDLITNYHRLLLLSCSAMANTASSCGLAGKPCTSPRHATLILRSISIHISVSDSKNLGSAIMHAAAGTRAPSSDPPRPCCSREPSAATCDGQLLLIGSPLGQILILIRCAVLGAWSARARQSDFHCLWTRARKQLDSAARTVSDTRWRA